MDLITKETSKNSTLAPQSRVYLTSDWMFMALQISGTVRLPVMKAEKFSASNPPSRGPARKVASTHNGHYELGMLPRPGQGGQFRRNHVHGCNRNIFSLMWVFYSEQLAALISESLTDEMLSITCFFSASLCTHRTTYQSFSYTDFSLAHNLAPRTRLFYPNGN